MAPLILHNVPEDELFIGEDGIQRPWAMVPSHTETSRTRRAAPETGSFGKSNRRSRSRTGTPRRERDNPTVAVADKIFGDWVSSQASAPVTRRPSSLAKSSSDGEDAPGVVRKVPTEMILRGYRNATAQYAAVAHFEELAGRICEDYPRVAPMEQRRYRSELVDPAFTQRQALTPAERSKVNMAAGGEHWVKVTFESAEAAETARQASPQVINGYLVYAEHWRGVAPAKDEACQDLSGFFGSGLARSKSMSAKGLNGGKSSNPFIRRTNSTINPPTLSRSATTNDLIDLDPPSPSFEATNSLDSLKPSNPSYLDTRRGFPTSSTTDILSSQPDGADGVFCRRIPTARRAKILPADEALLPQRSMAQRVAAVIPILGWFGGSVVGSAVPRGETGEFDWARASLYWKIVFLLDFWLRLFGGDIAGGVKEE